MGFLKNKEDKSKAVTFTIPPAQKAQKEALVKAEINVSRIVAKAIEAAYLELIEKKAGVS